MKDAIKAWGIQELAVQIARLQVTVDPLDRLRLTEGIRKIIDRHGLSLDDAEQANKRVRRLMARRRGGAA